MTTYNDPSLYQKYDNTYPDVQLACVSNMYVRMMEFNKDDIEPGHDHPFDHITLLARGSVRIDVDGKKAVFKAPKMIFIEKDKTHSITALEDNTIAYCIHAIRNGERVEDIVDPSMLPDTNKDILNHLHNNDMLKYINCDALSKTKTEE
jgi:quercetin dioxygenase-like cupin family protein